MLKYLFKQLKMWLFYHNCLFQHAHLQIEHAILYIHFTKHQILYINGFSNYYFSEHILLYLSFPCTFGVLIMPCRTKTCEQSPLIQSSFVFLFSFQSGSKIYLRQTIHSILLFCKLKQKYNI